MKHALFAAALFSLALTACGQKDAAAAKPEMPAAAPSAPVIAPAPASTAEAAPVQTPAPATQEADKPTGSGEADLKQR